jgi:hypothetical protein
MRFRRLRAIVVSQDRVSRCVHSRAGLHPHFCARAKPAILPLSDAKNAVSNRKVSVILANIFLETVDKNYFIHHCTINNLALKSDLRFGGVL